MKFETATIIVIALLAVGLIFVITKLQTPTEHSDRSSKFVTVCIDSVEYWERASGYKGYLAVKINKETLQPNRCE